MTDNFSLTLSDPDDGYTNPGFDSNEGLKAKTRKSESSTAKHERERNPRQVSFRVDLARRIHHQVKDVFCELLELRKVKNVEKREWVETARWVKFEEVVDHGGRRWSKPRVATLPFIYVKQLQKYLAEGHVILDVDGTSLCEVLDMLMYRLDKRQIPGLDTEKLLDVLLRKHHHQHEKKSVRRMSHPALSLSNMSRNVGTSMRNMTEDNGSNRRSSASSMGPTNKRSRSRTSSVSVEDDIEYADVCEGFGPDSDREEEEDDGYDDSYDDINCELVFNSEDYKPNLDFMRKIPEGAEACNILVGHVDFLEDPICVFVRLTSGSILSDLTEVPVQSRFLFIMVGPKSQSINYHQLGRAAGTLMTDEIFHEVAYKASTKHDIITGINEFLNSSTMLPPSEWDPKIRVEPPQSIPSQLRRRANVGLLTGRPHHHTAFCPLEEDEEIAAAHGDPTLERTGRLFGGLINDIKRKGKRYVKDFKDGIHIQCLGSYLFMYFACITSNITFGGLLGEATDRHMANIENLLGGAICGTSFALFGGQPLTILGSTGHMLVFEQVSYRFCRDNDIDYLPFRFCIGMWTAFILFLGVVFDLSSLIRFITKFTEESFAVSISTVFIYEAFGKMAKIVDIAPVHLNTDNPIKYDCRCLPLNATAVSNKSSFYNMTMKHNCTELNPYPDCINWTTFNKDDCINIGGRIEGHGCDTPEYVADVFFFSILLFLGTFTLAIGLKNFRNRGYLPSRIRQFISDFAVVIAIASMIGLDYGIGIGTPKLNIPEEFKPTSPDRGWIISPLGKNEWWLIFVALIPAMLATILIFMDQQITSVIVNRKENKLKKGAGYHLDLLVVSIQIAVCSAMGLPWFVAAAVRSMNHVNSLKVESETCAPGEKPTLLGVREQRVTGFLIFATMGCSVLLKSFLKFVPMPVLYGVFLYLGVSALSDKECVQRVLLIFMPQKYQPDYMYLRHVKIKRVHFFTFIQVLCFALLWAVKKVSVISIGFPLMVIAMAILRKLMEKIFTQKELFWLDDLLPAFKKDKKIDNIGTDKNEEQERDAAAKDKKNIKGAVTASSFL